MTEERAAQEARIRLAGFRVGDRVKLRTPDHVYTRTEGQGKVTHVLAPAPVANPVCVFWESHAYSAWFAPDELEPW